VPALRAAISPAAVACCHFTVRFMIVLPSVREGRAPG